jgi:hypothetical protein
MKELSLNILDIAMNSVKAGADLIKIEITESAYADNPVQVMDAVKKLHSTKSSS